TVHAWKACVPKGTEGSNPSPSGSSQAQFFQTRPRPVNTRTRDCQSGSTYLQNRLGVEATPIKGGHFWITSGSVTPPHPPAFAWSEAQKRTLPRRSETKAGLHF